jgi:hypothetical protein
MNQQEIIQILKSHYPREVRKQLVKTIQEEERSKTKVNYTTLNQIFSYVLKELHWDISKSSQEWNQTPLHIMKEVFPHLVDTKWYTDQILFTKQNINLQHNN